MIATSAARAALLNMTLTLSKELVGKGIRVNSILLGMVESGQWQRRFKPDGQEPELAGVDGGYRAASAASRWRVSASRRSRAGAAVPRLAAGFVYHRRALDVSGGFCRHL
jgi:NAD(P)-dependent dehydrogenase (short-subunit alcohol dehydrogenase family)